MRQLLAVELFLGKFAKRGKFCYKYIIMNAPKVEIKKLEKSQIEIIGEIDAEKFKSYWSKAIKELSKDAKIDGFRPGNIPEDILIKQIGEEALLHESAEMALRDAYPDIVIENKLHIIGRPKISLTKMAKDNPLGFKITTAVLPDIKLPDYKEIAKVVKEEQAKKEITVEEKEVGDVIEQIRKGRATKLEHKEGEETKEETILPELNDDFAKTLGDFKTVDELKAKITENIKEEKETRKKQETRMKIVETIADKIELEMPELLIEAETDRIINETAGQMAQLGMKFEDYLKTSKKTIEDIRKESRVPAEKRAKLNLLLKKIASEEKIELLPEEVETEVQKILDQYKEVDPTIAKSYIEDVLVNEKVFNLLEE